MELTHIDLFSGIGGFSLAGEWAGFKTIVFCEKDEFCQKVLKKHWPNVPITPEIRDFDGTKWRGATILTGGFPCQPFSVAGKQRGEEDDRYLWPEMLRVISEARPAWVLAENVAGIIHLALDKVLADLESEGYETETFIIPACAVNAPHRRDRVWIIAYCDQQGLQRCREPEECRRKCFIGSEAWEKSWLEVATKLCRVDDGLPAKLDGFELSRSAHRRKRLRALGNAIVPQIAYEIMKNIKKIEEEKKNEGFSYP